MIILLRNESKEYLDKLKGYGFVEVDTSDHHDIQRYLDEINGKYPWHYVVHGLNSKLREDFMTLCCLDTIRKIDCRKMSVERAIVYLKEEVIQFITDGMRDGYELGVHSVREINFLNKIDTPGEIKYVSVWDEMDMKRKKRRRKDSSDSDEECYHTCDCGHVCRCKR